MTDNATVYNNFKNDYEPALRLQVQQKESFLSQCVSKGKIRGEFVYTTFLAPFELAKVTGRNQPTANFGTEYSRRRIALERYAAPPLIDPADVIYMMENPLGEILQAGVAAVHRTIDHLIYTAFDADVQTDIDGSNTQIFPQDADHVVTAGSNLTVEKVKEAKTKLKTNLKGDWSNDYYLIYTPSQEDTLLSDSKASSIDYLNQKTMVDGSIDTFYGFNMKVCPEEVIKETTTGNGIRKCFAFTKDAVVWAPAQDVQVKVSERDDLNYSTQIYISMMGNALRHFEEKVVQVNCDES